MRAAPPDLVILDLVMPRMDGYELLSRLHLDEHLANIPVIIVTAQDLPTVPSCANKITVTRRDALTPIETARYLQAIVSVSEAGASLDTVSPSQATAGDLPA